MITELGLLILSWDIGITSDRALVKLEGEPATECETLSDLPPDRSLHKIGGLPDSIGKDESGFNHEAATNRGERE